MDVSLPPMEFYPKPGAKPAGFDVDLINEVAKLWDVDPIYKATAFPGLIPALTSDRCDVIWSALRISPDRLGSDLDAIPYYKSRFQILVRAGNPDHITSPADLSGKTVAVEQVPILKEMLDTESKSLQKMGKAPIKVQVYPSAADATQQLTVNRADAVLTLEVEARYRLSQESDQFTSAYIYPDVSEFGVYANKSDASLLSALQQAISTLTTNGTVAKVAAKWGLPTNLIVKPS
jgi:polar amino acid transport system substrate-binding protein